MAKRLKQEFGHLPIMVLLDGLYPNGSIMEQCRKNRWGFMIVFQDKSLPRIWEEYEGLKKLETKNQLECHDGVPLSDAIGPPDQCPGDLF